MGMTFGLWWYISHAKATLQIIHSEHDHSPLKHRAGKAIAEPDLWLKAGVSSTPSYLTIGDHCLVTDLESH
jgi:hypothetical protein